MLLLFVIGDVLGAGIYALVGSVAAETGGAIWAGFGLALVLALLTAFAYAELVTKYPRAAGAALYVNRAFNVPFVSFMVTFAVMCSGITSAATLSRAFGGDYLKVFIDVPTVLAGARVHRRRRARQLPRDQRVDQDEPRADDDRARRPAAHHRHRARRDLRRRRPGRRRPRRRLPRRRLGRSPPRPPAPRSRSTRSSASRTPSTSPRRRRTPSATTRARCSAACSSPARSTSS